MHHAQTECIPRLTQRHGSGGPELDRGGYAAASVIVSQYWILPEFGVSEYRRISVFSETFPQFSHVLTPLAVSWLTCLSV